ncbi:DUF4142 domain-containing protein [Pontibacter harenae]|uniref:DUF4142 domain-containing protein n=1 Tax=Pontibacter harenae TaxID=2894083 RepID=UPI001E507C46|nr:DUF4142 domain-containing protein [Pontibacter harenae]MCC9165219.1 DUF4142 domain-containing protein [Pontibacter harenae]
MKKLTSTGLLMGALLFGAVSCNQNSGAVDEVQTTNEEQAEGTANEDQMQRQSDFMTKAASSNMLEIQAGQLAQQKGQSQQVKDYGQMMVTDHTSATDKLKTLAQQKNITLPDSMGQDHMSQYEELQGKSGQEFDQAYMDLMVSSHEESVNLFEDAANNMEDPDVKSFASSTLPTLQQHLDRAKTIQENTNNSTARN